MRPRDKDVVGPKALAALRRGLTPDLARRLLDEAGWGVLARFPVGVGKTEWLTRIVEAEASGDRFGVVIVLVPRRDILRELETRLPACIGAAVLEPRPRKKCGPLDGRWGGMERRGLSLLARETLCAGCPARAGCEWLGQAQRLKGKRVVLATQQRLVNDPNFIRRVEKWTGARSSLLLIDESNMLLQPKGTVIAAGEFDMCLAAMEGVSGRQAERAREWVRLLAAAPTSDLRRGGWASRPIPRRLSLDVQRRGEQLFGAGFRFIGHDLAAYGRSDLASRERMQDGSLRFAALPYLGTKFMLFSGSMPPLLARYRTDPDHARPPIISPCDGLTVSHQGTVWVNLNTLEGAAKFFPGNAARIIDFFAALTARNVRAGKKTLLVTRKRFAPLCRRLVDEALTRAGVEARVVDGAESTLYGPGAVVLITYGVAGLNRFKEFEAAYCINSFYVPAEAVSGAVMDIEPSDARYPVRVEMSGNPRRRRALVDINDGSTPLIRAAAQQALEQLEADVVIQAVGRVRPFTMPREIITFHAGALPGVAYTHEFLSLGEARSHFGIDTPARARRAATAASARRLRDEGNTVSEIADVLGVGESTVKRHLRRTGQKPS